MLIKIYYAWYYLKLLHHICWNGIASSLLSSICNESPPETKQFLETVAQIPGQLTHAIVKRGK